MYVAERIMFCIKVQCKDILSRFEENILSRWTRGTQPSWNITEILGVVNTRLKLTNNLSRNLDAFSVKHFKR